MRAPERKGVPVHTTVSPTPLPPLNSLIPARQAGDLAQTARDIRAAWAVGVRYLSAPSSLPPTQAIQSAWNSATHGTQLSRIVMR